MPHGNIHDSARRGHLIDETAHVGEHHDGPADPHVAAIVAVEALAEIHDDVLDAGALLGADSRDNFFEEVVAAREEEGVHGDVVHGEEEGVVGVVEPCRGEGAVRSECKTVFTRGYGMCFMVDVED